MRNSWGSIQREAESIKCSFQLKFQISYKRRQKGEESGNVSHLTLLSKNVPRSWFWSFFFFQNTQQYLTTTASTINMIDSKIRNRKNVFLFPEEKEFNYSIVYCLSIITTQIWDVTCAEILRCNLWAAQICKLLTWCKRIM